MRSGGSFLWSAAHSVDGGPVDCNQHCADTRRRMDETLRTARPVPIYYVVQMDIGSTHVILVSHAFAAAARADELCHLASRNSEGDLSMQIAILLQHVGRTRTGSKYKNVEKFRRCCKDACIVQYVNEIIARYDGVRRS